MKASWSLADTTYFFFFSSRRRHTRFDCDWSSDVCSSDLIIAVAMLYVAGLDAKYIAGAGLASLPIIYLLIVRVSYRYDRVMAFLNPMADPDRKSTRLNSSHSQISYAVFCLKKKKLQYSQY